MKIFNKVILALPLTSLAGASSQLSTRKNSIRGSSSKNQEVQDSDNNNRLLHQYNQSSSSSPGSTPDYTNYESSNFDLMQDEWGDYGRCVDREGDFFDWMRYEWRDMEHWMSWEHHYGPWMCEEWCFGNNGYYQYFYGYDERRMNEYDYEYYYKYFIGFEVNWDGCSCLYDYEFGHWMESYGMDTSTWPGGRAPIYGTNGEEDTVCYGYNGYSQGPNSQGYSQGPGPVMPKDSSGRALVSSSSA